jgi:2,4-dienoyl-CoA reductase-like NADH-dependent reductase (Old Yellow Enzyme family)
LWSDAQIAPFQRIAEFVQNNGSRIGVQLAHAGRKAGSEALWEGGRAFTPEQLAAMGEPWRRIGPSAIAAGPGWSVPQAMTQADIDDVIADFVAATRRAHAAGFDVVELHFGHGYLVASFLSPAANHRTDAYGGSRENRMRLALQIATAVHREWPDNRPLFVRISAVDGIDGGWDLDDSVVLSRALKHCGVDVVDCSSGGLAEETRNTNVLRGRGFQVPYAARIRKEAAVSTQAVGVILDAVQAEEILQSGDADLIAIGRQALVDPYWAAHAARALNADPDFAAWPIQHGPWLKKRSAMLGE